MTCHQPRPLLLILLAATAIFRHNAAAQGEAKPSAPVIVEISADDVRFDREEGRAYARGNVVVLIRQRDVPQNWVRVSASEVASDLRTGVFEAVQGVRLESEFGMMAGASVRYDSRQGQILLRQGSASAPIAGLGGEGGGRAYFFGAEMGQHRNVIYVLRGRITTCDRANPHWYVAAREITYDTRTQKVKIRGGRVHIYGLAIPTISPLTMSLAPAKPEKRRLFTSVGYSSRDGVYFPNHIVFSGAERSTQVETTFRISTKRGWVGQVAAWHPSPRNEWTVLYARKETRYDDLDHYVAYDRAPEISFAKHLIPLDSDQSQTQRFTLSLSAGYYREIHERYGKLAAGRFQLTLERDYHTDQRDRLVGQWYGWGARWNKYTTGDDYGILHVYYGRGGRIAPNLAAALTGTYHLCAGTYPLRLDNPDIRVELTPMLDWDITDKWRVRFQARYDVSQEKFRDYTIQLDRQAHCLTWYVRYRDLGNSVAVGVNLSGITGGTRPYSAQPEPPELREGQRVPRPFEPPTGQQEETQKGQQDNGQASESPPQQ